MSRCYEACSPFTVHAKMALLQLQSCSRMKAARSCWILPYTIVSTGDTPPGVKLIVMLCPDTVGRVDIPECSPDGTVALEARAKSNLPHPVAPPHPGLCLNVGQHIPAGTAQASQDVDSKASQSLSSPGKSSSGLLRILNCISHQAHCPFCCGPMGP